MTSTHKYSDFSEGGMAFVSVGERGVASVYAILNNRGVAFMTVS